MGSPLEKLALGQFLCNQRAGIELAQLNCDNPARGAPIHCATGSFPLSLTSHQCSREKTPRFNHL
jgi:hypothetical protein